MTLRSDFTIAALLGLCFLALYALTLPGNRSESEDGFNYAWQVEHQTAYPSIHPHHLAYIPLAKASWRLISAVGIQTRAHPVMVGLSMLAGATCIAFIFLLFRRRLGFPLLQAFFAAAIVGSSYGFWRYACEAEIYILAAAPLMGALFGLTHPKARFGHVIAAAIAAACAVLIHVLAAIPALLAFPLLLIRRHQRSRFLAYILLVAAIVTIAYAALYIAPAAATPAPINAADGPRVIEIPHPSSLGHAAIGLGQSILSGNFLFCLKPFGEFMLRTFPHRMLEEEIMMGRSAGQHTVIIPLITLCLLGGLAAFLLLTRLRPPATATGTPPVPDRPAHAADMRARVRRTMWVWFALHALLLILYEPGNPEGWVMAVIPFWSMLMITWADSRPVIPSQMLGALFVLLLLHNYFGGMQLVSRHDRDYNHLKSEWLLAHTNAKDTILTAGNPVYFRHLRYHAASQVVDLQTTSTAEVVQHARNTQRRHGNILVSGDLFAVPAYLQHRSPTRRARLDMTATLLQPLCVKIHNDRFGGVWQCRPPSNR